MLKACNILSRSSGLVALHDCHNLEKILISNRTNQVVQSIKWSYVYGYLHYDSFRVFNDKMVYMLNDEGGYILWENHSITFTSIDEFCWLDISNCESLTYLPAELLNLKFLRRLCLRGCSKLEELPEIEETMENLKVLILDKTSINELPSSFHRLIGLEELSLQSCTRLKAIPNNIVDLYLLSRLDCSGCCRLTEVPNNIGCMSSLTELSLQGSSIVTLPESMACLSSLKSLDLSDCKLLECIPELPPHLNHLFAFDCPSIKRVVPNPRLKLVSDSKEDTFKFHLTNSRELDASFWSNIGDEACIKITEDAYNSVSFCFPGSVVPCWFHYSCQGHSVTMKKDSPNLCSKSRLIGFALCVVLEREVTDDTRRSRSLTYKLGFEYDGRRPHFVYDHLPMHYLNWKGQDRFIIQDHTFLWKYHFDLASIGNKLFHAHSFTFEILDEQFRSLNLQSTFTVKECGLCPLYTKENDDNAIEESSGSRAAQ